VEPARNIAAVARERGIPTAEEFFNEATARRLAAEEGKASVILGRHVFAHINDLHDFFRAVDHWLTPQGTLLIEVPYLGNLLEQMEFARDSIRDALTLDMKLEDVAFDKELRSFRLHFNHLFHPTKSVRELLPEFNEDNKAISGSYPDPTFGNVVEGLTQKDLR
jgi:SAM-dependent methyltransferase